METADRKLLIEQLDRKIMILSHFKESEIPTNGWIHAIRTALNMSLTQLAKKLGKSVPTMREIELREESRSITLKKLMEIAEALDLKLVYGFIPKDRTLENMIEKRAAELARKIVMNPSQTMQPGDLEAGREGLEKAINEQTEKIILEMPGSLWD